MRRYRAHDAFVAPARLRSSLLLLVLGFTAIELGHYATYDLIDALLLARRPDWLTAFYTGATPLGLMAQLMSFAGLGGFVVLVARLVHKRSAASLTGPPRQALRQFLAVLWPLAALLLVIEILPPWWSRDALDHSRPLAAWLWLLPAALMAIFVQIAAEELLYRGYLQQQLAALFARPVVWLVLTNLAFALAHWTLAASPVASLHYAIWAFAFGLCASDLTARAGTLGPALAFHMANNAFAFLLYGEAGGPSSGFALFLFAPETLAPALGAETPLLANGQLAQELAVLGLMWLAARRALTR
ncbi:CPBP family intramembrane glutamic endopeptidase [uncultured Lentibacter sp.]|jgi:membrane protease YdiL (CAAX protease family)|uniref:CPBP family intramembrane glutamic endopeptidase n=1 Tax=uncultured Lentibacter sp. TaxID=1659309 RepID=UPI002608FC8C|nr:CPBP family intramembrane glutamic endopeptidase [uncultured Lentibacter sp.]